MHTNTHTQEIQPYAPTNFNNMMAIYSPCKVLLLLWAPVVVYGNFVNIFSKYPHGRERLTYQVHQEKRVKPYKCLIYTQVHAYFL